MKRQHPRHAGTSAPSPLHAETNRFTEKQKINEKPLVSLRGSSCTTGLHPAACHRHSWPWAHETCEGDPEPLINRYEHHLWQRSPPPGQSKYTSHGKCSLPPLLRPVDGLRYPPLQHTRIEGEEGVERVCAGLHRVPSGCVSNDRQHLAVVPLDDGVAEDQLVFTVGQQSQDTHRRR